MICENTNVVSFPSKGRMPHFLPLFDSDFSMEKQRKFARENKREGEDERTIGDATEVKKERISVSSTANGLTTDKKVISLNGNGLGKMKEEADTSVTTPANDKDFEPMYE